jgi:RND family efflux transporter MFP subunit
MAWLAFTSALVAAPPEVVVVRPVEREVTDYAWLIGRTEPGTTVEIRPRATGLLEKAFFPEGAEVRKGDVLFQLDDRLQRAELARAEAGLARAEAEVRRAELEHRRLARLADGKAVEREEVDKSAAGVESARAGLMATRAGLELAKLNLDQTSLRSPIDGRIGRALVDAGNLVKADGGPLAVVVSVHPLRVAFDVDESTLLRIARRMREAGRGEKPPVAVGVGDEDGYPHRAALDGIDHQPDPKSGAFRARATLANPKGELLTGVLTRVRVPLGPRKALYIPKTAFLDVREAVVLVLTDKQVLEAREVRPGNSVGDLVEVQGLKPDDRVVADPRGRKGGEAVTPRKEKDPPPDPKPAREPAAARPRAVPEPPGTGPGGVVPSTYPGTAEAP